MTSLLERKKKNKKRGGAFAPFFMFFYRTFVRFETVHLYGTIYKLLLNSYFL